MQPLTGRTPAILVLSYLGESRCRVAQLPGASAPTAAVTFEPATNTLASEPEAIDGPAAPFGPVRNKLRVRHGSLTVADHM